MVNRGIASPFFWHFQHFQRVYRASRPLLSDKYWWNPSDSYAAAMNYSALITRFRMAVPAAGLLCAACSPTDSDCTDICAIWSVVEGNVVTTAGVPIREAVVAIRLMYDGPAGGGEITCQLLEGPAELVTTDAAGAFSVKLDARSIAPPACAEITVNPPPGSALMPVSDTVFVGWSRNERSPPVRRVTVVLPN